MAGESRYCPTCGAKRMAAPAVRADASLSSSPQEAPTIIDHSGEGVAPASRARSSALGVSGPRGSSVDHGRFTPGEVVADRYRIIEQLGKGGMGEVYRADDLKLAQPVALKFLPAAFEADPERLERFLGEVRLSRQISHANVCRVYDIGTAGGQHFLTMEYVDGEDLASLLKRIGRIPSEKATEIARQLCAGLAAAHAKGILHRDLKPANVMLDRQGKVRITDFGLAGFAEEIRGLEIRVGTPDYMAPEQLEGREVSVRSDLYSLGLILYELYTGRPAFAAESPAELRRLRTETTPASVGSVVPEIDPAVERIVERCLEQDPARRPASALAVAAALPGGDPLSAALAAGETPSPEMVAAAGQEGALRPALAWAWFACFLLALAGNVLVAKRMQLVSFVPFAKRPEVLIERGRDILGMLGYPGPPADSAAFFAVDRQYLDHLAEENRSPRRWEALSRGRPAAITLIYRDSPEPFRPLNRIGIVQQDDPPSMTSGMSTVEVDTEGRLVHLSRVPPQTEEPRASWPEPDWKRLFDEAGLDIAAFTPVPSTWNPAVYADRKAAWTGTYPGQADPPIRIEAASYHGKPLYFEIVHPWTRPTRQETSPVPAGVRIGTVLSVSFVMLAIVGAITAAVRNIRLGRGDRRGAFRFALAVFLGTLVIWALSADHIASLGAEFEMFVMAMGRAAWPAGLTWLLYVALEPIIRKNWPESMVSWTRLLAGRYRDPMIGRDLLVGAAIGFGLLLVVSLIRVGPGWFGMATPAPAIGALDALLGPAHLVSHVLRLVLNSTISAVFLLFFMAAGLIMSRKNWTTTIAIFFGFSLLFQFLFNQTGSLARDLACAVVISTGLTFALARHGVITAIMAIVCLSWSVPIPGAASAWYAAGSFSALLVLVLVVAYGFYRSLAGVPLFGRRVLED